MNWKTVHGWFAESSLVRKTTEAILRAAGRCHLARLDRQSPVRCQTRILLHLLRQARDTLFGRDHDFRRIRTIADFRRLVPLRTRADFWRQYWQPIYPRLPISLSGLQTAHRLALRTALALAAEGRPRTPLFSGAVLLPDMEEPASVWERGNPLDRLPALLRPYAKRSEDAAVEQAAHLPATCLIGAAERLLPLLERVKQIRGKRYVREVWPGLSAILFAGRSPETSAHLRAEAEGVPLLEMVGRAEGPIAVEDPRSGLMRLLFDHGVYFEFVPPQCAGEPRCPRYGIEEIETGVPYELALSSPAGLWACRVGRTICLERRDPPLVRFVETIAEKGRPRRTDLILPNLAETERHPQIDGIPATPLESSFHSPWSTRADRG